jgi:Domain of unknown function (DUF4124)
MKSRYLLAVFCAWSMMAQADIYKATDENGHVTYSSTPIKGGKKLVLEPLPTMVPPGKPVAASGFPKVDGATQKERDETRRKILQDELNAEEKLLKEAKNNLENAPTAVYVGEGGKTYRNVAKYDEGIKEFNDQIDLHQKNVDALKTELSKIK